MNANGVGSVLVTGGSGFVGACAVRALLRRGVTTHVLLRDPQRAWRLADILDRLEVHEGDLRDAHDVRTCFNSARPSVVLHLATHGAYEAQSRAADILETNILGTQNLLEFASAVGTELFVQTGSSSEYGYRDEPMRETDRVSPNSHYAVAKAAQTHLGQLWSMKSAMAVVCLRLFSVFGPWEEPTRLIPTLIRRARANLPLELAARETARDFVYVDDVVRALLDFPLLRTLRGEVVNIGSGRETKLSEVVETVVDLLDSQSPVCWGRFPARCWDASRWCGDIGKAERLLGWRPRVSLRQGLEQMAAWMAAEGDDYGIAHARLAG